MISERRLKKWRREALKTMLLIETRPLINESVLRTKEIYTAFLEMNQELLDQRLIKQNKGGNKNERERMERKKS